MRGSTRRRDPRSERSKKWPPADPISPDGRLAGLTTTGCVIVSAAAWFAVGLKVSMCSGPCAATADAGALVTMATAVLIALMLALTRAIWIRPVDVEGSTNWRFGLSAIFFVGVAAAATRIASVTCPPGTHMSIFHYCSGRHDARIPLGQWAWLKNLIDLAALVIGVTLIGSKRWVRVTAPIAAAVFLFGTGWFLLRTLAA